MEKTIDLQKTVYELCKQDGFVIEIMKELGFENITKPGMMQTAGKIMTIPRGARMRGIDITDIIKTFERHGYVVVGN